jgi:hypothetical protein
VLDYSNVKAKFTTGKILYSRIADKAGVTTRFHSHVQLRTSVNWNGGYNGEVAAKFLRQTELQVLKCGNIYIS